MKSQIRETRREKPEIVSSMLDSAKKYEARWERLGESMIESLNKGQWPRVMAVGPAIPGGLKHLYGENFGHTGRPGKVFEVTCRWDGTLDAEGLGSVFYGVKHLRIKRMEIWGPDFSTQKTTLEQIRAANIEGFGEVEVRRASTSGNGAAELKTVEAGVLCCSDSRVQAYQIFNGSNVVVVSNAGNILSPVAVETFSGLVQAGVPILAVLGHSGCGAVGAAIEENNEPMLAGIVRKVRANILMGGTEGRLGKERHNALVEYIMLGRSGDTGESSGAEGMRLQQLIKERDVERMAFFLDLSDGTVSDISSRLR